MAGVEPAAAVTNGRLLLPAKTVTLLSVSIRTAISAPTRLRRSARIRPAIRPEPDNPTSAFGALATIVPCASRTTISRMRSAVRPLTSRSNCVPPTSTSWPPPIFSLIAAVSQGVAMSSSIGPLESRHHSATIASRATPTSAPATRVNLRRRGHPKKKCMRQSPEMACAGHILEAHGLRGSLRNVQKLDRGSAAQSSSGSLRDDAACGSRRSPSRLASSFRSASRFG